ncbi:MAG: hypothetical protein LQ340_003170, partial [Diploschistes diacapsis]
MSTPTLDQFLSEIAQILRAKDGSKLQDFLAIEPPLPPIYKTLADELRRIYPQDKSKSLEEKCESFLPADDGPQGGSWPAFISFLVQYLSFLRDLDPSNLVSTHEKLKSLFRSLPPPSCILYHLLTVTPSASTLALSDASMGATVLATTISYSRLLARLSILLEKQPNLTNSLRLTLSSSGERLTLAESSATTIRDAFKRCLSDRPSSPSDPLSGRRSGIYHLANLALKLLSHANNLKLSEQIFHGIQSSPHPPTLRSYPASQRVTYLYHLGRYLFLTSHFHLSTLALSSAYAQCHAHAPQQRRKITTHLLLANLCLGRFATPALLSRSECAPLTPHLLPLYHALKLGDLASLRTTLALPHPTAQSLLRLRALFQVQDACDDIAFRSLARRCFLLAGFQPGPGAKQAPNFSLRDLATLVALCERRQREGFEKMARDVRERYPAQFQDEAWVEPDLRDEEDEGRGGETEAGEEPGTRPEAGGALHHRAQNALGPGPAMGDGDGDDKDGDGDRDEEPSDTDPPHGCDRDLPLRVESRLASLIHQGFLHAYLSRKHGKLVVLGAKARPAAE